jgi:hypothetical protein
LFGSTFHARASDAEWRAGVTLWLKSWDQVPAGSLPADDIDLCRLAELARDLKAWAKVKLGALRGWFMCSDGRLYHPVVAEGVNNAIEAKAKQRLKTAKARIAALEKHLKEAKTEDDKARITEEIARIRQTLSQSLSQTLSLSPREGEERGNDKEKGISSSVPTGTDGGEPPAEKPEKVKSPGDIAKAELWRAAIAVLAAGGCQSEDVSRSFMGKLVKDYGLDAVREAVAAAATEQPADAREYLKATCMHLAKERTRPVTVAENPQVRETAAAHAAEAARVGSKAPEHLNAARAAAAAARERRLGAAKDAIDAITGGSNAAD